MTTLTRRTALAGLASIPATAALTANVRSETPTERGPSAGKVGAAESPIMQLFRKWEAHYQAADNVPDEICDAQMAAANAIARRMMALPSSSATDMAAKFIVSTGYGEWVDNDKSLLNEARWLVGEARS